MLRNCIYHLCDDAVPLFHVRKRRFPIQLPGLSKNHESERNQLMKKSNRKKFLQFVVLVLFLAALFVPQDANRLLIAGIALIGIGVTLFSYLLPLFTERLKNREHKLRKRPERTRHLEGTPDLETILWRQIKFQITGKLKEAFPDATWDFVMTVANLFGVPLGTSLSHILSWRVTFLLVACWGVIVLYYIWRWVPAVEGLKDTGFKGQFRFLKTPAPWLILGATALGNGGVFCWYSYITPLLTNVSGFSAGSVTALMMLAGFGMVVGNLVSGRLSDKYTPGRVGMVVQGMICIVLLLIFFLSPHPWCSAILMALCTAGLFAVSSPEQVLIIRVAPGGEMLGGACVQMAFNLGNAIGAYVGGLALGGGYRYPALAGVPFALTGFILFVIFYKKFQSRY